MKYEAPPINPMPDLCAVTSREMVQLQSQIESIEDAVLAIIKRSGALTSDDRKTLQDFDLVIQTLAGLTGFFERLEKQVSETGQADMVLASEAITLRKLKDRLRTACGPLAP